MTDAVQETLVKSLLTSHSNTQNTIKGIDLEIIVYEDPPWQLRDVLWHIAVWDRQVTKSLVSSTSSAATILSVHTTRVLHS